ncbi:MAG: transposase [Turicibacter sp.]|nr:transposase [Turicibacter sp.]MBQ1786792.1 transposase [Turicibacter sp.]
MKNTLTTPYTNGPIEGINNKIKVIKRIAFGYRSFYHWVTCHAKHVSSTSRAIKSRILITQNLTKPKLKILVAMLLGFELKPFIVIGHKLISNTI